MNILPTEAQEQIAFISFMKINYPNVLMRVGMEGGKRNPFLAKRLGIASGFPDIQILEERKGFKSLFIELKRVGVHLFKKDGLTPIDSRVANQLKIVNLLNQKGHKAMFCFGAVEAIELVQDYFKEG